MKRFVIVAVALGVGLAGCGKPASEKVAEKMIEAAMAKDGVKGKVDIKDGTMTIQSKDGKAEIATGGNAKIPDTFPKDVHVYEGATVIMAISANGGYNISLESKDTADKIAGVYKTKMTADGWKEEMNMNQAESTVLAYKKGARSAMVTIVAAGKQSQITLTVSDQKAAAKTE